MRGELMFCCSKIKMVHLAATFEPSSGFAFVGDKAVQTRAQISLKAGFPCVVSRKVVLFEGVGEEPLRQILGVFVIDVPFQANVFVRGFPVAREDRVEGAMAKELIERFNKMLAGVTGLPEFKHVTYIDLRGTLPTGPGYKDWWANELHPTPKGYRKVAEKFVKVLAALP